MTKEQEKWEQEWEAMIGPHKEDLQILSGPLQLANYFAQTMASARNANLSPKVPTVAEEWAEEIFSQWFEKVGEIAKQSGFRKKLFDRNLFDPRLDGSPDWNDGLTKDEIYPFDDDDPSIHTYEGEELIEEVFGPITNVGFMRKFIGQKDSKEPLSGQYNRLFPVKIVLRVAASLIMNRDEQRKLGEDEVTYDSLELQDLREECLKVATYAKARFELMDSRSETEFGERLSVGLPDFSGKKSKKQKERFVSQFVGSVKKKGRGLPFELGLLSINSDGDVEFTDWGVHFMLLDNPIIDEVNIEAWKSGDSFSDEEKSYLVKMIEKLNPGEFDFMTKITEWIKNGKNRPKQLDELVSKESGTKSTEASLLRSGLTARMLELGLIRRDKVGREVMFSIKNS